MGKVGKELKTKLLTWQISGGFLWNKLLCIELCGVVRKLRRRACYEPFQAKSDSSERVRETDRQTTRDEQRLSERQTNTQLRHKQANAQL